jgi:hypothetical protein
MAIHYYDEDTIEVGKPIGGKVVVNHSCQKQNRDTQKTRRNTKKRKATGIIPMPIKKENCSNLIILKL